MYKVRVPNVYVDDRLSSAEEISRMERMLLSLDYDHLEVITPSKLARVIRKDEERRKRAKTGEKRAGMPSMVFTTFDWSDGLNDPFKSRTYSESMPGRYSFADYRDKAQLLASHDVACNSGFELNTAFGCFHSCTYCHVGNVFTVMLDIKRFIANLSVLMMNNPSQRLFKYGNQSDVMTLEPEYGATSELVEHFSKEISKRLLLYTKSDNVDFLLDLEHEGNTDVCWTLSCDDVASSYEIGAPSLDRRLEAARKVYEAGYGVRFRFSPLIPIEGWEEKNRDMVRRVFETVEPTVISLETLCHMNAAQANTLYPELAILPNEQASEYELFRFEDRKRIYDVLLDEIKKQSPRTRTALCLEKTRMCSALGQNPASFYCVCGEKCY